MVKNIYKWLRQHYYQIVNSIAFYPAIIAIGFLVSAYILLTFDFSDAGKEIKSNFNWLTLKDSSTARTMVATVAAGIISLAVFSFSMVMILLNQAAVNMSNRVLDNMIGNRYHQTILGFYVGTIVYAFFLLSTIRDIDSGVYIPSISVYLLIILTIIDIFLFIHFLHYITQSVKYETIINRIHDVTLDSMKDYYTYDQDEIKKEKAHITGIPLLANESGYLQGFAHKSLPELCKDKSIQVHILHPLGTYILRGYPIANISGIDKLDKKLADKFMSFIDIYDTQTNITRNPFYGCKQLTEVAIKALSPGINDPGTAILSLNALCNLLTYRLCHAPENAWEDDESNIRVYTTENTFEEYFNECILPIWDYGKQDRLIQQAMQNRLTQLYELYNDKFSIDVVATLLLEVRKAQEVH